MRKQIFKTSVITISLISVLLLSGCDSNPSNTSNSNSTEDPMESGHLQTTIENQEGQTFVNIDANIIGDDSQVLPVATMERHDLETEDIVAFADNLFDNSEYNSVRAVEKYTVDELDTLIEDTKALENIICTSDKTSPESGQLVTGTSNYSSFTENLEYYNTLKSSASTTSSSTVITDYTTSSDETGFDWSFPVCALSGTYNNLPCEMWFMKMDSSVFKVGGLKTTSDPSFFTTNLEIVIDASEQPAWGDYTLSQLEYHVLSNKESNFYDISTPADNECKYSVDDAILLCDTMVKQLGIADMSASRYCNLMTTAYALPLSDYYTLNTVEKSGNCGYQIFYEKTINGTNNYSPLSASFFSPLYIQDEDKSYHMAYGYECLVFTVLDCGIVSVDYANPLDIVDIPSDNTPLLDFGDITGIADTAFTELYGNDEYYATTNGCINIDTIRLDFMRITIDENNDSYSLIPVWVFIEKDSYKIRLSLNAIDGSIVTIPTNDFITY